MRDWEKKPRVDKTWVHYQAYFTALFNDNKRFGDAAGNKHGFERSANIKEQQKQKVAEENSNTTKMTNELCDNLREVAIAATADKEHIQQMTSANEDLLKNVKEQQKQISQLIKQNSELTFVLTKKENNSSKKDEANNNQGEDRNNGENKKSYGCTICGSVWN